MDCSGAALFCPSSAAWRRPRPNRVLRPVAERVAIRGRVTAADTGAPLARAVVRVFPRPGNGDATAPTDATGRYELRVPPGTYTFQAGKPAYMTLSYGQRRAFERGTLIEVRAGDAFDDVDFVLPRGAVIAGTVYEPFGEPAVGVDVRILRYEFRDGGWSLERTGGRLSGTARDARGRSTTDYTVVIFPEDPALRVFPSRFVRSGRPNQDGEFAVSGLPPARYLAYAAQAIPRGAWTNPGISRQDGTGRGTLLARRRRDAAHHAPGADRTVARDRRLPQPTLQEFRAVLRPSLLLRKPSPAAPAVLTAQTPGGALDRERSSTSGPGTGPVLDTYHINDP